LRVTDLASFFLLLIVVGCTTIPTYSTDHALHVSSGLPVNSSAHIRQVVAKGPQRIIVLLAEFPDKNHTTSIETIRNTVFVEVDALYQEVSYGLMWIAGDITDRWYRVQTPLSKLDLQQWTSWQKEDMRTFVREAVAAADNDVDFGNYDFVIIVAAGKVWPNARCDYGVSRNDTASPLKGLVVNENSDIGTYAHELGHVLPSNYKPFGGCGLPDLYSYELQAKNETSNVWIGPWDLMAGSWNLGFCAWSRFTLGWLTPEDVLMGPAMPIVVNLQPLERDSGTRMILIPLNDTASYVIEVRRKMELTSDYFLPAEGVLIYSVNLDKKSGYGVLRVYDGEPATKTLEDAPLVVGGAFEDQENHVYILVADINGQGFTVVVSSSKNSDTDGDGLEDWLEVTQYGTSPLKVDTDGDLWQDSIDLSSRDSTMPNGPIIITVLFSLLVAVLMMKRRLVFSTRKCREEFRDAWLSARDEIGSLNRLGFDWESAKPKPL